MNFAFWPPDLHLSAIGGENVMRGETSRVVDAGLGLVYMADLVRRITSKNRHPAFETGQPRGKEGW
jgi:hypothetical protein